jgi:hypothetical protein
VEGITMPIVDGYYYLHTNGDLIYKRFEPEADSPFVKHFWPFDHTNRMDAWIIVLEATALGANMDRIKELKIHWGLTLKDFCEAVHHGFESTPRRGRGIRLFVKEFYGEDASTEEFWNKVLWKEFEE